MNQKQLRRAQAMRRDKQKKHLIAGLCIIIAIIIAGAFAFDAFRQRNDRVFEDHHQTVTLRGNGTFTAQLHHNVVVTGTYTEDIADGATTITFINNGSHHRGSIDGEILTLPSEWDDGCDHNRRLSQSRGR